MLLNLTFNILTSFSKNFLCTNVLQTFSHHNLFSVAKTKVDYSAGAVSFLSLAFHVVVFTQCFVLFLFCFLVWMYLKLDSWFSKYVLSVLALLQGIGVEVCWQCDFKSEIINLLRMNVIINPLQLSTSCLSCVAQKPIMKSQCCQSSGAVWKLMWPSWAFRPNEPYGFCGRKATLNRA